MTITFVLIFKIPKLSLNTKFRENFHLWNISSKFWYNFMYKSSFEILGRPGQKVFNIFPVLPLFGKLIVWRYNLLCLAKCELLYKSPGSTAVCTISGGCFEPCYLFYTFEFLFVHGVLMYLVLLLMLERPCNNLAPYFKSLAVLVRIQQPLLEWLETRVVIDNYENVPVRWLWGYEFWTAEGGSNYRHANSKMMILWLRVIDRLIDR